MDTNLSFFLADLSNYNRVLGIAQCDEGLLCLADCKLEKKEKKK